MAVRKLLKARVYRWSGGKGDAYRLNSLEDLKGKVKIPE